MSGFPSVGMKLDLLGVALAAALVSGCSANGYMVPWAPDKADGESESAAVTEDTLDEVTERILEDHDATRISEHEPEVRVAAADRPMVDALSARDLSVRYTERGVVVTLPDVVFEFGSSTLTRGAKRKVRSLAEVLLEQARGRTIAVEGHTDSIGAELYNQGLSEKRAESVAAALRYEGVPTALLTTAGFGSRFPIADNEKTDGSDNPQGRTRNRRVEVVISN